MKFPYQGTDIDLTGPWARLSVAEAVAKYSGFKDQAKMGDRQAMVSYLESKKLHFDRSGRQARSYGYFRR